MSGARAQFIHRESFPSPEPKVKIPENYVVDRYVSGWSMTETFRLVGQAVKTLSFHGSNTGSSPVRVIAEELQSTQQLNDVPLSVKRIILSPKDTAPTVSFILFKDWCNQR